MEKRETSYTVGGIISWKTVPQNTKNRIIIWSRNPTPGHNPGKTTFQKDTCTSVFIALFTGAKTWKQTKWPSIDEQMKRWYIYTLEYYSAVEKNEIMPFAVWMQLEITLNEVRQEATLWYHLYMGSKIQHTWTCLWNRNTITGIENRLIDGCQGGGAWGREWVGGWG